MYSLVPFDLGAVYLSSEECLFRVWAPSAQRVSLRLLGDRERLLPMTATDRGYHEKIVPVAPGQRYFYRLDDLPDRPDPTSRWQPEGPHGPSAVFDPTFPWQADWPGLAPERYIFYELHIGTFTRDGTFDAASAELPRLRDLGVTAVEVMPVAQFPGARNWGYDGAFPYAVQNSYGGPAAFQRFIDAAHQHGLAVVLDVVYNHLGPEGNYLPHFGPIFSNQYRVPWGDALNFDGRHSDEVRRFFLANALYWQTQFRLDGLRLDAVDQIKDSTATHFLAELAGATGEQAQRLGRPFHLIGESDQNDARLLRPPERGGHGLGAQWADDFHHSVHTLLTGERNGYYQDFGTLDLLARAYRHGFAYDGQWSPYRGRRHGGSGRDRPAHQFVICVQNHDQVGNRAYGDRLSAVLDFDGLKLAAGLLLLAPGAPLIFMGEEYGETAPFCYFTSHTDADLAEAVRRGRRAEFAAFAWQGEVPDPQAEETFLASKLRGELADTGHHRVLFEFYRELLRLRRTHPALAQANKEGLEVLALEKEATLFVRRWAPGGEVVMLYHLGRGEGVPSCPLPRGAWNKVLASAEARWHGRCIDVPERITSEGEVAVPLSARSFVVYQREGG